MENMHNNKRLRQFSIAAPIGSKRLTQFDIASMPFKDYMHLREHIQKNAQRKNSFAAKRQAKELLRKLSIARKKRPQKRMKVNPDFKKSNCILLDAFYPGRANKGAWKPFKKRRRQLAEINLDKFSFIDCPEETIGKFEEIASAECSTKEIMLNYVDGLCFDMGPYIALALVNDSLPKGLANKGKISSELDEVLSSAGLLNYMNIVPTRPEASAQHTNVHYKNDLQDVMTFSFRKGGGLAPENLAFSEQRDEKVADDFVNTLKSWVRKHNPKQDISAQIATKIKNVMTELFDNALRHGAPETETGEWHTAGVLQKKKNIHGRDVVVCNFSIVNIGLSVSDTLMMASDDVMKEVDTYIQLHKSHFPESTLRTVCAMQDKISRIHAGGSNAQLNGIGLMTSVMNVFSPLFGSNLQEYQPSFTMVSGDTWIQATQNHINDEEEHGKRNIAFNEQNDISLPPDSEYVKTLSKRFPGTVISIRFIIGADQLEEKVKKDG